jgi:hypothetical protein
MQVGKPKLRLPNVTLLGIDCVNLDRLILAARISTASIEFGAVKLLTSIRQPAPFETVFIDPITTIEAYSKFCICDLYRYVDTPHVLIIQHDGFILNPSAWTDEFLAYDYIGAPWAVGYHRGDVSLKPTGGPYQVGNGGFSLRSRKFLVNCSKLAGEGAFKRYDPEDLAICADVRDQIEALGMRFAPIALAARFSIEYRFAGSRKWRNQFGFHHFRVTDISRWTKAQPGWGIQNRFKSPRPRLAPWKAAFWSQLLKPKLLAQQCLDWIR